jgi:phosphatidylglycerophosphatase A
MINERLIWFIATGFGTGRVPVSPGTAGTLLMGIPLFLFLRLFTWPSQVVIVTLLTLAGIYISQKAAAIAGHPDPAEIVIDEIIAVQWLLIFLPPSLIIMATGIFFFRLFDLWKPPPLRWMEKKIPGGAGIMADDLAAVGYAWLATSAINHFWSL